MKFVFSLFCFLLMVSCRHSSPEYLQQYAYLDEDLYSAPMIESDYFLIILVDARHLDYSDNLSLLRTLVKHPNDGSKNSDVGHAWIYLKGVINGENVIVEGGHSGELGVIQAKYFEGVINNLNYGTPNPSSQEKKHPRYEPNPIKYLWATQHDGFFQKGPGKHRPTFAAKVDLTEKQFHRILAFVDPLNYHYPEYALTGNQCSSFVAQVASLADFSIEYETTITIESHLKIGDEKLRFWEDSQYATFTFSTPDVVERSLMGAVRGGRAENALEWYLEKYPESKQIYWQRMGDTFFRFPERIQRVWMFF